MSKTRMRQILRNKIVNGITKTVATGAALFAFSCVGPKTDRLQTGPSRTPATAQKTRFDKVCARTIANVMAYDRERGIQRSDREYSEICSRMAGSIRWLENPVRVKGLIGKLTGGNYLAREHAISQIGNIAKAHPGNKEVLKALFPLIERLKDKKEHNQVREAAARVLGDIKDKRALDPLIGVVKDRNEGTNLRFNAIVALGRLNDRRAIPELQKVAENKKEIDTPTFSLRRAAREAIRSITN